MYSSIPFLNVVDFFVIAISVICFVVSLVGLHTQYMIHRQSVFNDKTVKYQMLSIKKAAQPKRQRNSDIWWGCPCPLSKNEENIGWFTYKRNNRLEKPLPYWWMKLFAKCPTNKHLCLTSWGGNNKNFLNILGVELFNASPKYLFCQK